MFWQSVIEGVSSLADWHVLVGVVGVSLVSVLYLVVSGLLLGNASSGARVGAGFAFMFVGGPVFQALAVTGFVLLCLPVIIGSGGFTPAALVGFLWWPVVKQGFIALIIVIVLCFLPIIGRIIAGTPGVPVFLQGVLMLKPISKGLYYVITGGRELPDSAFPSFWQSIGYLVIALVLCWVAFLVIALVSDQIKKRTDPLQHMLDQYQSEPTGAASIAGMFIGPVIGIIPLLMYGRYVHLAIGVIG
jgi:hypothetical protein